VGAVVELVVIVALAIGLALGIQAFVVKPYAIPSESMLPTLEEGQRVLVNRVSTRLGSDPALGDVVVFHPPKGAVNGRTCGVAKDAGQPCPEPTPERADENFIKRVVAGPGDTLSIDAGIPIVNGEPLEGDWEIRPCRGIGGCDFPQEITIPPDHYFMMGDNRGASDDSRYWGPVPRDWIIGEAFFTYWPIDRIGFL
jgi:signal peptidase I